MTQEESELLANATLARDQLRAEEQTLKRTIEMAEIRLDMVRELLALLEGRPDAPRPARNRRRANAGTETPATQPELPAQNGDAHAA